MAQAEPFDPSSAVEQLTPGAVARDDGRPASIQPPCAAVAAALSVRAQAGATLIHVASSERRAEEIGRALRGFAPGLEVLVLPPWDCLPYDRASPSRDVMGRRMAVAEALMSPPQQGRIVITAPEALIQRLPPQSALGDAFLTIRLGQKIDREVFAQFCRRTGYVVDDRIDEPGEVAILGAVIDVFPPAAALPYRLLLGDGDVVEDIRPFDPLSQRTIDGVESLRLGPASELIDPVADDKEDADGGAPRAAGVEHDLAQVYDELRTLFDLIPIASVSLDPKTARRLEDARAHLMEAYEARRSLGVSQSTAPPDSLYLDADEIDRGLTRWRAQAQLGDGVEPLMGLSQSKSPGKALSALINQEQEAGRRVVLAGQGHELKLLARALRRGSGLAAQPVADWAQALAAQDGSLLSLEVDADGGFLDPKAAITLICASDVFGGRVAARRQGSEAGLDLGQELRLGDVVLHEDHGLGVLRDLVPVELDGAVRDTLQLEYRGGDSLLVPVEEIDKVWRYGADAAMVTLDRLKGDAWTKRRALASAQIDEAAASLVALAKAKAKRVCSPIVPPKAAFDRFVGRFPYPATDDQARAVDEVMADLASGRPMDRLICADVGYGKTEVALRAAAAAALSGRQVMLAAPTTVLARQHFEVFKRRFAGFGVGVAQLSRLVSPAEAKTVREGLASGEIRVVIGTHALGADDLVFDALGLVIIDEEQKFGAALKAQLRDMAGDQHILTLTATPIPRTLQAAIVGLQDVSVIATPPARRRPVRTFLAPFDAASLRTALYRERRRGGQSFIVAPRIEDLEPLKAILDQHAPGLGVRMVHGDMVPEAADEQMVAFAQGEGDVLLATNIIESGLDVPRANTMVIWRPDRFGLAQLHQLRGRVGRGRVQGVAYLLTDQETISEAARSRLSTLEAFDRLGSGLAISARDLDLRGGGDLVGDDQAGHIKLIGAALYQRLMERALRQARGETVEDDWSPQIQLGESGGVPADYCPDPTLRLNLYARLARSNSADEVDAFEEEVIDRLGPPPPPVVSWIAMARVRLFAKQAGARRISVGPKGMAVDLPSKIAKRLPAQVRKRHPQARIKDGRLILDRSWSDEEQGLVLEQLLEALADG